MTSSKQSMSLNDVLPQPKMT